ncbi:MAG: DUF3365 domain-containing protein [Desulfobacterales bacterium]
MTARERADSWERDALKVFEQGVKERIEFTKIENEPYFRLMRPMVTEKGCLKCHGFQGYKVGDIRGGVSVSIPLSLYLQRERKELMQYTLTHILLWILGIGGIFFIFQGLKKSITERKWAEVKIINEKEKAEKYLSISEAIILGLDTTGIVTLINRRGCDVLGYEEKEILGKNWFETVIPTEQRDMIINVHNKVIAGEMEPVEYFENEVITKAGERKYM